MNSGGHHRRWTSGPAGRHLRVRLKANNRQFNGTYFRGGSQLDSFKEGSLVHVIFCLEPVLNHPEWESKQDIWLKILHIEAVRKHLRYTSLKNMSRFADEIAIY